MIPWEGTHELQLSVRLTDDVLTVSGWTELFSSILDAGTGAATTTSFLKAFA